MRKEEKTRRTYERILSAAMAEFGSKSYDAASLTTICNAYNISKGLIYHNFRSKDDLYLKCVERCFLDMRTYFQAQAWDAGSIREGIQNLLRSRQQFFESHPDHAGVFFYTVLSPPEHLRQEIKQLRKDWDDFYVTRFRELLAGARLRPGVTLDAAMQYVMNFFEMYNGYFRGRYGENADIHGLMEDHEGYLANILDFMLYGIAEEK